MNNRLFTALDAALRNHPLLISGPAGDDHVREIQTFCGFQLPEDYKDFVRRYGGAVVGPYGIFGHGAAEVMGYNENSAIEVTARFRSQGWPGSEHFLVVSIDHAGNPIMLNERGEIWRFDHDSGSNEQLARNFEGFVLDWCLKT